MNFFQIFKLGLEISQKCCCNTAEFLQEIAFYHLVRVFKLLFHKFGEYFLHSDL